MLNQAGVLHTLVECNLEGCWGGVGQKQGNQKLYSYFSKTFFSSSNFPPNAPSDMTDGHCDRGKLCSPPSGFPGNI